MKRHPRPPYKQFFDWSQIYRVVVFGVGVGMLCFFLYLFLLKRYDMQTVSTIVFTSVVVAQWANGIQAQKEKEPFFKNIARSFQINPYIFWVLIIGIFLQLIPTYFSTTLFKTTPMTLAQWIYPLSAFVGSFLIVEIRKWVEFLAIKMRR